MTAAHFTYNRSLEAVKRKGFPVLQSLLRDSIVIASRQPAPDFAAWPKPITKAQDKAERSEVQRQQLLANYRVVIGQFLRDHPWLQKTPQAIRDAALEDLIKAHESNQAKQQAMRDRGDNRIHRFDLHYRYRVYFPSVIPSSFWNFLDNVLSTSLYRKLIFYSSLWFSCPNRKRKNPSSWTIQIDQRQIKELRSIPRPLNHPEKKNGVKGARRSWSTFQLFPTMMKTNILLTEDISNAGIGGAVRITRSRTGHYDMHVPMVTPWESLPQLKPEAERKVCLFPCIYNPKRIPTLSYNQFLCGIRWWRSTLECAPFRPFTRLMASMAGTPRASTASPGSSNWPKRSIASARRWTRTRICQTTGRCPNATAQSSRDQKHCASNGAEIW